MDIRPLNNSRPTGQRGQQIVSGIVSTEKPAPASFIDPLYVVITRHSSEISYPLPWPKIHGNTLPAQGAYVLVGYDENNKPTVISWEGANS